MEHITTNTEGKGSLMDYTPEQLDEIVDDMLKKTETRWPALPFVQIWELPHMCEERERQCWGCPAKKICEGKAKEWNLGELILRDDDFYVCRAIGAKWISKDESMDGWVSLWEHKPVYRNGVYVGPVVDGVQEKQIADFSTQHQFKAFNESGCYDGPILIEVPEH